jgi:hypothetical protein
MTRQTTFSLRRGQRLHLHVVRGTHIVAASGSFEVTGPMEWLSDTITVASFRIAEGEAQRMERGGMVAITGKSDGEVLCLPAPRRAPALLQRVAGWLSTAGRRLFSARIGHA